MSDSFQCEPLHCSMSRGACAARHRKAKTSTVRQRRKGELHVLDVCGNCNVGAAHAAGEPTPASFESLRPAFDPLKKPPSKNFGVRKCPGCGKTFRRRTGNHGYCTKSCAKRDYRLQRSLRLVQNILIKAKRHHGLTPASFLRRAGVPLDEST